MKKITTKDVCFCAMFSALSAIGAFIRIPIPICPFTLQLTFTTFAGLMLGKKRGALSVAIYVIIGLLGIPVFTEGGGIAYIFKPTFGYIIGFIIGAYVSGSITDSVENPSFKRVLAATYAGLGVVYIFGMTYMYVICNYAINSPISAKAVFISCFLIIIPKDIIVSLLTSVLAKRLIPITRKMLSD